MPCKYIVDTFKSIGNYVPIKKHFDKSEDIQLMIYYLQNLSSTEANAILVKYEKEFKKFEKYTIINNNCIRIIEKTVQERSRKLDQLERYFDGGNLFYFILATKLFRI